MNEGFYRAFEDKYRGSRELILGRLNAYAPLLKTLKTAFPEGQAVDLGCGRGEWLELLSSFGINATGVDLDEGMLAACRERGYDVVCEDAIGYLGGLPTESLALVSAFHLVEHIPFDALARLVSEALRVLKPGGILIMETPNPENLCVGTESFYLDPSHVRPIPPKLLSFLPEYIGFARTKVLRLQEPMGLMWQDHITLSDVLTGVSPDYAVVTQKESVAECTELFDPIFSAQMGVTLERLTGSFEERMLVHEARLLRVEHEYSQQTAQYAQRAEEYAHELLSVYNSTSWRITRPLRSAMDFLRDHGISKSGLSPKTLLRKSLRLLDRIPLLRKTVSILLKPFPGLRIRLMEMRKNAVRDSVWPDRKKQKAITYNFVDLDAGSLAPVDEIIARINRELESRT